MVKTATVFSSEIPVDDIYPANMQFAIRDNYDIHAARIFFLLRADKQGLYLRNRVRKITLVHDLKNSLAYQQHKHDRLFAHAVNHDINVHRENIVLEDIAKMNYPFDSKFSFHFYLVEIEPKRYHLIVDCSPILLRESKINGELCFRSNFFHKTFVNQANLKPVEVIQND